MRMNVCAAYQWRVDRQEYAPRSISIVVHTLTMIRSLCDDSVLVHIPNELLFLIFEALTE